ncbi:MAG: hypothetical protein KF752_00580 [Pirellulaceae bacterium]|nr:hypothetical protein [Pirellulaceae bacterium]
MTTWIEWTIAGLPIAIYLMLIGGLRLRRRPLITSGGRESLTLGIACSGLIAIGPMQLFFPEFAAVRWPGWVWILMFGFYFMLLLLILVWNKPRLIAYGVTRQQFHQLLLQAAQQIDEQAAWHGAALLLPQSGLQLAAESAITPGIYVASPIGGFNNVMDWIRLERALVRCGQQATATPTRTGWLLLAIGMSLLATTLIPVLYNPNVAYAQLREFLLR